MNGIWRIYRSVINLTDTTVSRRHGASPKVLTTGFVVVSRDNFPCPRSVNSNCFCTETNWKGEADDDGFTSD